VDTVFSTDNSGRVNLFCAQFKRRPDIPYFLAVVVACAVIVSISDRANLVYKRFVIAGHMLSTGVPDFTSITD